MASVRTTSKTSTHTGVTWHRTACMWAAEISLPDGTEQLGLYHTEDDAARAYDHAARWAAEEFGCDPVLNLPGLDLEALPPAYLREFGLPDEGGEDETSESHNEAPGEDGEATERGNSERREGSDRHGRRSPRRPRRATSKRQVRSDEPGPALAAPVSGSERAEKIASLERRIEVTQRRLKRADKAKDVEWAARLRQRLSELLAQMEEANALPDTPRARADIQALRDRIELVRRRTNRHDRDGQVDDGVTEDKILLAKLKHELADKTRLAEGERQLALLMRWPREAPPRRNSPRGAEARLGSFLERHVFNVKRKDGKSLYPEVVDVIRRERPHWFAIHADRSRDTRPGLRAPGEQAPWGGAPSGKLVRDLAREKLLSPELKRLPRTSAEDITERRLAFYLRAFTSPTGANYDPDFARELSRLKPAWARELKRARKSREGAIARHRERLAETRLATLKSNKERILRLRKRPVFTGDAVLAQVLKDATDPAHKDYDRDFDDEIRRRRPEWFDPTSLARHLTKEEAQSLILAWDEDSPPREDALGLEGRLGGSLRRWINSDGVWYDHDFTMQLRATRPRWKFKRWGDRWALRSDGSTTHTAGISDDGRGDDLR